ncbi:hypothetical protein HPB50_014314 [Hyalomma asiaticum]|uniref:Uncharacterized protein n=1 Tax=Hyalomma asiaticum TaxID=266040 RepID=A0ACB7RJ85_HYAAI|nr:hypothetical protein HPB50_014314 [Hyalomma asiaticum]
MNFIGMQIEAREKGGSGERTSFSSKQQAQRKFRSSELQLSRTVALSAEVRSSYSRPCLLCNTPAHAIQECSDHFTPEEQCRRIQASFLCFRCTRANISPLSAEERDLCSATIVLRRSSLRDINHITKQVIANHTAEQHASAPQEQAPESVVTNCRATTSMSTRRRISVNPTLNESTGSTRYPRPTRTSCHIMEEFLATPSPPSLGSSSTRRLVHTVNHA